MINPTEVLPEDDINRVASLKKDQLLSEMSKKEITFDTPCTVVGLLKKYIKFLLEEHRIETHWLLCVSGLGPLPWPQVKLAERLSFRQRFGHQQNI